MAKASVYGNASASRVRAAPPAEGSAPTEAYDPIIWRGQLREMLGGISSETVRLWIGDKHIPEPDVQLSLKAHGWKLSTLRAAGIPLPNFSPKDSRAPGASQ